MVEDFFEELICIANLSMVRSVSNMFSVGEVSLNIYMICLYQRVQILTDAFQHELMSSKKAESCVCTYYFVVLYRKTLIIGHKIGKNRLQLFLLLVTHMDSPSSVVLLLPFCSKVIDPSLSPKEVMKLVYMEEVFTLFFSCLGIPRGCLLDTNLCGKNEPNFIIS